MKNRIIAKSLLVGMLFFTLSLILIKNKTYYEGTTLIPKGVFKESVANIKEKIKSDKKELKKLSKWKQRIYELESNIKEFQNDLENFRVEKSNNYIVAVFAFIGGTALGYLKLDREGDE